MKSSWGRIVVGLVAITAASSAFGGQQPVATFRSGTGVVLVPVWVKDGERLVSGLSASDFEVTDNGVTQEIASVSTATQPVDVTIVLDTSRSLDADRLSTLKEGVNVIGRTLAAADRIRLLSFSTKVTEVFGFRSGGEALPLERLTSGGATALYDALAAALITAPRSERPQLVFGISDGRDNASALKPREVEALAGASGASLYVTVVRTSSGNQGIPRDVLYVIERLRQASDRTGGLVIEYPPDATLPKLFAQVLTDFRTSYLLSFSPRGVRPEGWHDVVVRTTDRRYSVRARTGYQG